MTPKYYRAEDVRPLVEALDYYCDGTNFEAVDEGRNYQSEWVVEEYNKQTVSGQPIGQIARESLTAFQSATPVEMPGAMQGIAAAHFKSERDIHIAESQVFVREATDKFRQQADEIARLKGEVERLRGTRKMVGDALVVHWPVVNGMVSVKAYDWVDRQLAAKSEELEKLQSRVSGLVNACRELKYTIARSGMSRGTPFEVPFELILKALRAFESTAPMREESK